MCHSDLMKRRWMTYRSSACTSILTVLANRVDNFKRINMKLQTSKLSMVWSKWKVCTPFTNFRWSQTMIMSKLLPRGLESGQLGQFWQCNHYAKNDLVFMCSHTKAPQWVFIKDLQHFPQDQEVGNWFKASQNRSKTL